MWKLACARRHTSPTSAYIASHLNKVAAGMQLVEAGLRAIQHPASPAQPHRKSPEQGGQRGCSLWKLACARSAYQNSLSILSCIPAMHLPPPRTALAREPHATAPVPGPHDAHDAARAAYAGGLYAYVPGMHKQVCSCTLDGVTATAPAETADCTRTAPAHPRESRITRAAEGRLNSDLPRHRLAPAD